MNLAVRPDQEWRRVGPIWEKTASNSERGILMDCPHKGFLRLALGLVPDRKARPLYKGGLFHVVMDEASEYGSEEAIHRHRARLPEHLESEGPEFMGGEHSKIKRVFHEVDWMARAYHSWWGGDRGLDWPWEVLQSERRNMAKLIDDVWLVGIQDKLVKMNGQLWIVDHKTSGERADEWYDKRYSSQGATYVWIVSKALGQRVAGIIYDVVHYPNPKRSGLEIKYPMEWEPIMLKSGDGVRKHGPPPVTANMYKDILEKVNVGLDWKPWVRKNYNEMCMREDEGYWFTRIPVPYSMAEIRRAIKEWWTVATQISKLKMMFIFERAELEGMTDPWEQSAYIQELAAKHGAEFPRAFGSCKKFGRMCPYRDFCEHPEELPPRLIFKPKRDEYADL